MRILYVQEYLGGDELLVMPIGLLYIATAASSHEAKLFDMNASKNPYEELGKIIHEYDPHVVALSLRNIDSQQRTNLKYYYLDLPKTLQLVKTAKPEVTLVAGGPGFPCLPRPSCSATVKSTLAFTWKEKLLFPLYWKTCNTPTRCLASITAKVKN
ncbi:cobalamin-dependent protein [Desulfobulbus sp. US4]|nr:cobalamin-dependent protein [Desulfobulbus sp. US4]